MKLTLVSIIMTAALVLITVVLTHGCIEIDKAVVQSDLPITASGSHPVTVTVWHNGEEYTDQVFVDFIIANSTDTGAQDPAPIVDFEVADTTVDINAGTLEDFDTLPGIGPAKAQAILDYRESIGGFTSVEQLLDVVGIGPATLEKIRPFIVLGNIVPPLLEE